MWFVVMKSSFKHIDPCIYRLYPLYIYIYHPLFLYFTLRKTCLSTTITRYLISHIDLKHVILKNFFHSSTPTATDKSRVSVIVIKVFTRVWWRDRRYNLPLPLKDPKLMMFHNKSSMIVTNVKVSSLVGRTIDLTWHRSKNYI